MWTPNWWRLFAEWRCKAIWVPFSDEEMELIKNWTDPKDIQSWKIGEKTELKIDERDEKEIKKQLKQELRNKWISFTNFDTLEKLQEKLQTNL